MHILIVKPGPLPHRGSNGSCVHLWSLIVVLIARGHRVEVCGYGSQARIGSGHSPEEELSSLAVPVHFAQRDIPVSEPRPTVWQNRFNAVRQVMKPRAADFYEGHRFRHNVGNVIGTVMPDLVITWGVDAVISTNICERLGIPRVALIVDLDHLVKKLRLKYASVHRLNRRVYHLMARAALRGLPRIFMRHLSTCDFVVEHAHHHFMWLQKNGITRSAYLPVAVLDRPGTTWRDGPVTRSPAKPYKITLVGHVEGIATREGLAVLSDEILPRLEHFYSARDAEVHIIGGGRLSDQLQRGLDRPMVKMRGYIEDLDAELRSSDVVLVPTPIELGFRTRISEAFSYGCCVVAHSSNACGMPELRHGENALLSGDGRHMADQIAQCLRDRELRVRLGMEARRTYEQELKGEQVCGRLVDLLEQHFSDGSQNSTDEPVNGQVSSRFVERMRDERP